MSQTLEREALGDSKALTQLVTWRWGSFSPEPGALGCRVDERNPRALRTGLIDTARPTGLLCEPYNAFSPPISVRNLNTTPSRRPRSAQSLIT